MVDLNDHLSSPYVQCTVIMINDVKIPPNEYEYLASFNVVTIRYKNHGIIFKRVLTV